jgi:uncharacterized RDD family membrane protein YckC
MGSWLDGPTSVQPGAGYPGQRLGLPQDGPGSVATLGKRIAGTLIDMGFGVAFGGLAYAFSSHPSVVDRNLFSTGSILFQWIVLWPLLGQTIGMRIMRIRLVGRDGRPPKAGWSLLRVLLLIVPVPYITGVTLDGDNRGIQDKASGTTVINC